MAFELRVGVAGLGSAAAQILPAFANVEGVRLGAGADIRAEARDNFKKRFDLPAFDTVEAMCRSSEIDAVWIATPNVVHCEHTVAAADNGKHVICEKPTAVSLEECDRMVAAAERDWRQIHPRPFEDFRFADPRDGRSHRQRQARPRHPDQ